MRALCAILALFVLCLTDAARCAEPIDEEFLRGFMVGEYDVIGRKPDSATPYSGRITLRVEGTVFQATRTIEGTTTKAAIRFDTVGGADRIPVLRMRFALDGVEYEATFRWQSDPDNYPRFTGIIYRIDHQTKSPGIEAFFPIPK
jgi:hypothetical protein